MKNIIIFNCVKFIFRKWLQVVYIEKTVEPEVEPEEVQEIIEKEQIQKQKAKPDLTTHSDNVKMVMDLFDGKVID